MQRNGERAALGNLIHLIIAITFACLYKKSVDEIIDKKGTLKEKNIEDPNSDDFQSGICGCMDNRWVCIHGCCCGLVRLAHTNAVAGMMGFWQTIMLYFCCSFVPFGPCCLT